MPSAFNNGKQRRVRFPNLWAKIRAANPCNGGRCCRSVVTVAL